MLMDYNTINSSESVDLVSFLMDGGVDVNVSDESV